MWPVIFKESGLEKEVFCKEGIPFYYCVFHINPFLSFEIIVEETYREKYVGWGRHIRDYRQIIKGGLRLVCQEQIVKTFVNTNGITNFLKKIKFETDYKGENRKTSQNSNKANK